MIAILISFNLKPDTSSSRDGKPKKAKKAKRTAKRGEKRPKEPIDKKVK